MLQQNMHQNYQAFTKTQQSFQVVLVVASLSQNTRTHKDAIKETQVFDIMDRMSPHMRLSSRNTAQSVEAKPNPSTLPLNLHQTSLAAGVSSKLTIYFSGCNLWTLWCPLRFPRGERTFMRLCFAPSEKERSAVIGLFCAAVLVL